MFIKQLSLFNYCCFKGLQTINFKEDSNIIFVKGEYWDNPKESNQSGKSSLLESIPYLLFGEIRKDAKETDYIHFGEKEMYVEGILNIDGLDVHIKRVRYEDGKASLTVNEYTGTNSVKQDSLNKLLGFTYKDFISTNYFLQGNVTQFSDARPAERKRLLIEWLGLERWQTYENKAKVKYNEFEKNYEALTTKISTIRSNLTNYNTIEDDKEIHNSITVYQGKWNDSCERANNYQVDLSKTVDPTELQRSVHTLTAQIVDLDNKIQTKNNYWFQVNNKNKSVELSKKTIEDIRATIDKPSEEYLNESSKVKDELALHQQTKALLEKDKYEYEKMAQRVCAFTGVCPVDNKPCDKGTRIPDQKKQLLDQIEAINGQLLLCNDGLKELTTKYHNFTNNYKLVKDKESSIQALSMNNTIVDLSPIEGDINAFKDLRDQYEFKLLAVNQEYKKLDINYRSDIQAKISKEKQYQALVQAELGKLHNKLGVIQQQRLAKVTLENDLKDLEVKLTDKKKDAFRWSYITGMLSRDGIPSILIENKLEQIEEFGNLLLDSVSRGKMQFEFKTQKELPTKEVHCSICGIPFGDNNKCKSCGFGLKRNKLKDEIDINVVNEGKNIPFPLVSDGMGKLAVSLSLRLALSKILKSKCDVLVLDEIFASLDEVNRNNIAKLVFNSLKNLMGIKQVFVISHCDLNDLNYSSIRILRNKQGFSEIQLDKQP